ncbi:MAG: hypothetical protein ACXWR0_05060 [Bdellovibrio sp.]
MDSLARTKTETSSLLYEASLYELLTEISERICSLYKIETSRDLNTELISLTFEEGQIKEIRTDVNEIIFEY